MKNFRVSRSPLGSPPLGTRLPGSVHSVTCSIPTMRDVIGYEEKDPETVRAMTTGYPRFVTHFYIHQLADQWRSRFGLDGRRLFFTASPEIARQAVEFGEEPAAGIVEENGLWAVHLPAASPAVAKVTAFMQHTGGGISSRLAERRLLDLGLIPAAEEEELAGAEVAETEIRREMAGLFGAPEENVFLASSGMNAFYAVFRALHLHQQQQGRDEWVQLGWLYVDTIEILRKFTGGRHHLLTDVFNLEKLDTLLRERGGRIAGIVTEAPTNPLIQMPDLERLRELALRHGIPLVVDPTLASPYNIDVLPFCDVAVNSLTKYAANEGDVMMGALVLNPDSAWTEKLRGTVAGGLIPPYIGELRRLAVELRDYRPVMEKINANTVALTAFLEGHPSVERVYGAYSGAGGKNYAARARREGAPGGVISILLRKPVAEFYDRVRLPKGPSFGARFTILCPFIYLAHYNLVTTEEGRRELRAHNLHPELLRISVGAEEADAIIDLFAEAL